MRHRGRAVEGQEREDGPLGTVHDGPHAKPEAEGETAQQAHACPLPAKGHNDGNLSKLLSCGNQLAYTLLPPAGKRTQRWEFIKTIKLWRSASIHTHTLCPANGHNDGDLPKLFNCGDQLAHTLISFAQQTDTTMGIY